MTSIVHRPVYGGRVEPLTAIEMRMPAVRSAWTTPVKQQQQVLGESPAKGSGKLSTLNSLQEISYDNLPAGGSPQGLSPSPIFSRASSRPASANPSTKQATPVREGDRQVATSLFRAPTPTATDSPSADIHSHAQNGSPTPGRSSFALLERFRKKLATELEVEAQLEQSRSQQLKGKATSRDPFASALQNESVRSEAPPSIQSTPQRRIPQADRSSPAAPTSPEGQSPSVHRIRPRSAEYLRASRQLEAENFRLMEEKRLRCEEDLRRCGLIEERFETIAEMENALHDGNKRLHQERVARQDVEDLETARRIELLKVEQKFAKYLSRVPALLRANERLVKEAEHAKRIEGQISLIVSTEVARRSYVAAEEGAQRCAWMKTFEFDRWGSYRLVAGKSQPLLVPRYVYRGSDDVWTKARDLEILHYRQLRHTDADEGRDRDNLHREFVEGIAQIRFQERQRFYLSRLAILEELESKRREVLALAESLLQEELAERATELSKVDLEFSEEKRRRNLANEFVSQRNEMAESRLVQAESKVRAALSVEAGRPVLIEMETVKRRRLSFEEERSRKPIVEEGHREQLAVKEVEEAAGRKGIAQHESEERALHSDHRSIRAGLHDDFFQGIDQLRRTQSAEHELVTSHIQQKRQLSSEEEEARSTTQGQRQRELVELRQDHDINQRKAVDAEETRVRGDVASDEPRSFVERIRHPMQLLQLEAAESRQRVQLETDRVAEVTPLHHEVEIQNALVEKHVVIIEAAVAVEELQRAELQSSELSERQDITVTSVETLTDLLLHDERQRFNQVLDRGFSERRQIVETMEQKARVEIVESTSKDQSIVFHLLLSFDEDTHRSHVKRAEVAQRDGPLRTHLQLLNVQHNEIAGRRELEYHSTFERELIVYLKIALEEDFQRKDIENVRHVEVENISVEEMGERQGILLKIRRLQESGTPLDVEAFVTEIVNSAMRKYHESHSQQ